MVFTELIAFGIVNTPKAVALNAPLLFGRRRHSVLSVLVKNAWYGRNGTEVEVRGQTQRKEGRVEMMFKRMFVSEPRTTRFRALFFLCVVRDNGSS